MKQYLSARSSIGTVTLYVNSVHAGQRLEFIGSSLPASANAGDCGLQSLSLALPMDVDAKSVPQKEDETEVVAFATQFLACDGTPIVRLAGIFEVTYDEKGVHVELEKPFAPRPDRLGQVRFDGNIPYLCVRVGEEWYTSRPSAHLPDARVVRDANILCRYLAGKDHPDSVKSAVEPKVWLPGERPMFKQMIDSIWVYPPLIIGQSIPPLSFATKCEVGPIWQTSENDPFFTRFYHDERMGATLRIAIWNPEHRVWTDQPD